MNQSGQCALADGFSLWQKLYAQGTFFTFTIAASIGIARADWPWLIPYALVCWYGVPGIVMRHLTCPRCAHLHRHGDCLQFPAGLAFHRLDPRHGRVEKKRLSFAPPLEACRDDRHPFRTAIEFH